MALQRENHKAKSFHDDKKNFSQRSFALKFKINFKSNSVIDIEIENDSLIVKEIEIANNNLRVVERFELLFKMRFFEDISCYILPFYILLQ